LVQYIKLAMAECGLGSEVVRAPRLPLVGAEREKVQGIIRKRSHDLVPGRLSCCNSDNTWSHWLIACCESLSISCSLTRNFCATKRKTR
jgi:hypothetical protein